MVLESVSSWLVVLCVFFFRVDCMKWLCRLLIFYFISQAFAIVFVRINILILNLRLF